VPIGKHVVDELGINPKPRQNDYLLVGIPSNRKPRIALKRFRGTRFIEDVAPHLSSAEKLIRTFEGIESCKHSGVFCLH
jgi:hypothetical protein